MADKKFDYESCCIFFVCAAYLIPTIPVNMVWTFSGWLCGGYDSCGSVIPKHFPLWKRAIFPCEHGATENIPVCEFNHPSPYVFFAPFYWVRSAYNVLTAEHTTQVVNKPEPQETVRPEQPAQIANQAPCNPLRIVEWRSQIQMS